MPIIYVNGLLLNFEPNFLVRKSGAIHSLANRSSTSNGIRSSWSNFTANISASSVADSVHAHRQQFLQRRAKFSDGAATQTDSKPSKRFEIELKALKLGEQKPVGKQFLQLLNTAGLNF
jgi:hypothetical protein